MKSAPVWFDTCVLQREAVIEGNAVGCRCRMHIKRRYYYGIKIYSYCAVFETPYTISCALPFLFGVAIGFYVEMFCHETAFPQRPSATKSYYNPLAVSVHPLVPISGVLHEGLRPQ